MQDNRFAAAIIGIELICNHSCLEVSLGTDTSFWVFIGIEIFWQHKFDAFELNVPTSRSIMRWNRKGLHAALIFHAFLICFGQDDSNRDTFARTDIFDGGTYFDDSSQRFHIGFPKVNNGSDITVDHDRRIREDDDVAFIVSIGDGLIYLL